MKNRYFSQSPQEDFTEFAAAQKTNELIAGYGAHLKKKGPTYQQTGIFGYNISIQRFYMYFYNMY